MAVEVNGKKPNTKKDEGTTPKVIMEKIRLEKNSNLE